MLAGQVLADSTEDNPIVGGLIFFSIIGGALIYLAWDLRRHPKVPCPSCHGSGRHYSAWNPAASGPCRGPCRGKGWVRRPGAPIQ